MARVDAEFLQNDSPGSLHVVLGLLGSLILVLIGFALWALWYRHRKP
ncbi:MAG TPA: hypothetical protein VHX59_17105 [Mycobacteriales bacterium]|jgi:hypothetical protein|nr:hypothetical protein [Mycobacteriales bacterium]